VVSYYHVGLFFNNFLPANVGGDLARTLDASRSGSSRATALSTVILDRLIGTVSLGAIAVITTLPALGHFHLLVPYCGVLTFFVMAVVMLRAVLEPRVLAALEKVLSRVGLGRFSPALDELSGVARGVPGPAPLLLELFAVALGVQLMRIGVHCAVREGARAQRARGLLLPFRAAAGGDSLPAHLIEWHRGTRRGRHTAVRPGGTGPQQRVRAPVRHLPRRRRGQHARRAGVLDAHPGPPGESPESTEVHGMIPQPRMAALVSVLVLLVSAAVYLITLTPTVPFWDSGEFIAVATILGVPHPPGTPFYVLLGRIATLVPWASIAQRVNALSAIAGALAVFLTYLSALRLIRLSQGNERQPWHEWVAIAAAGTGALLLAFSDAFWENSIEAEVYSLMSLAQILVFWLGLRWWEAHDRKPTVGPLLTAVYIMWLCVGLHLGVGIMGAPLLLLVFLVDRSVAALFLMPFLTLLRVPAGLEKMAGAIIVLSAATMTVMAARKKLNGWVVLAGVALSLPGWALR
jgi:hypothetical protein